MLNLETLEPKSQAVLNDALVKSGDYNETVARQNGEMVAKAFETPLRKGIMAGNNLFNIFEPIRLGENSTSEFPLHFLRPGTEDDYVAYTIPNHGYIPQRNIEGDYVMVPTFDIGAALDWNIKYARDARWDVYGAAMEVMRDQFVKKMNDDGWRVLMAAGYDRNLVVADSDAAAGQFTKRLISLLQNVMRRNGGGNSTSTNRGKLTDVFMSPEAMMDIRNWNVDQVDEVTRREIFVSAGEEAMNRIFGVNLHVVDELGEGQEYQVYYDDELGGALPAGDVELIVGLDLSKRDSFIMPIREDVQIFNDESLHRQRRQGVYGWAQLGFAALDNRRIVLGSL